MPVWLKLAQLACCHMYISVTMVTAAGLSQLHSYSHMMNDASNA